MACSASHQERRVQAVPLVSMGAENCWSLTTKSDHQDPAAKKAKKVWCWSITHDGSMVLLYMVCHGSHQYTPVMLAQQKTSTTNPSWVIFPSYFHHISIIFPSYIHYISIIFPSYIHHISIIYPWKSRWIPWSFSRISVEQMLGFRQDEPVAAPRRWELGECQMMTCWRCWGGTYGLPSGNVKG